MPVDFRVYLVTDRGRAKGGDILAAVAAALDGGIRAVQLREKDLGGRELFRLTRAEISGDSLAKEAQILITKWVARGLTQAVLQTIRSQVFNVSAPVGP